MYTARILWAENLERARDKNEKQVSLDLETIVDGGVFQ